MQGIRDQRAGLCARVEFVKCMRAASVSIEALIEYMDLFEQGEQTAAARKAILEEQRGLVEKRIADMQAGLDRLNAKIENYEGILAAERSAAMRGAPSPGNGAPGCRQVLKIPRTTFEISPCATA